MTKKLYYETVSPLLLKVLKQLMLAKEFADFRLVGGTALGLQRGHRLSIDIDLFTDAQYDSVDFKMIDNFLRKTYNYVDTSDFKEIGFGKSYFVGESKDDCVKLDIFYTDPFIQPVLEIDSIRLASTEEIIAMKLDVVSRGGRKKDFWDIDELKEDHRFKTMLSLHKKRYPYSHDAKQIKKQFSDFTVADEESDPVCLKGKIWELIKLDMIDFAKT